VNLRRVMMFAPAALALVLALGPAAPSAVAQLETQVPVDVQGVDIIERLDANIPLDLPFTNEEGESVTLRDYFTPSEGGAKRPIILQLGYLRCPMLCNMVLNGGIEGLKGVDWNAGETFQLISVSINPEETHQLAKLKRDAYLLEYNRPGAVKGFHFLTGPASSSHKLAEAVGFGFRDLGNGDFSHPAALFVITPDGRISRYLYGTTFEPRDLRLALLEASEGKIGSSLDRFILWCYMYDPDSKSYVLFAKRLMQLGGVVTLAAIALGLGWFWRGEVRRRRALSTGISE
jgi:protein SCO1